MPDVSLYYIQTGFVEPGYFVSEPAPPAVVKVEKLTVFRDIDSIVIFENYDSDIVYDKIDDEIIYRVVDRITIEFQEILV